MISSVVSFRETNCSSYFLRNAVHTVKIAIPISQGTVASGTMSTTSFVATGATLSTIAGAYLSNPSRVVWTSGVLRCSGSYAVTAYSGGSSPTITVATMPAAPSFDDTFDIVG